MPHTKRGVIDPLPSTVDKDRCLPKPARTRPEHFDDASPERNTPPLPV
jgi:hypothetical protein